MMFTDLPDHCLLLIFDRCNTNTLATLTTVCTKLKELICAHLLYQSNSFALSAVNTLDVAQCLVTVARLVRALKPTNFHVKVYRNLLESKEMPLISVDTDTSSTEVFVESHFLESVHCLNNIGDRIKAITIFNSIYDYHDNDPINLMNFATWSNVKKISITGNNRNIGIERQTRFPNNILDVNILSFSCMFISAKLLSDAIGTGRNLKNIIFQNCNLNYLSPDDIMAVASKVRTRGGHFPLDLTFINVDINYDVLLEVMLDEDFQTYAHIQLEPMFPAGNSTPSL